MRINMRKTGIACGTAFASIAVALSTATGAMASNTAVIIGGIGAGTMGDRLMLPLLGYAFKDETRVNVSWPATAGPMTGKGDLTLGASIDIGITNLSKSINDALKNLKRDANGNVLDGEKVTVVGLSAGSLVVDEVMRKMLAENKVDADDINFILVEDSSRQKLIKDATYNSKFDYTYHLPPVTPYDVTVITGEYDGMADLPDRWWNGLAVMNAMAGAIFVHVPVMYNANLATVPEKNITVDVNSAGGTTTHYLVPTGTLPIVQLIPSLKPREAELKAKIDAGYARNDVPKTAVKSALVAAPEAATVDTGSDAAVEPAAPTASQTKAQARAEAKAAKREARAAAKADAAAKREAKREARAAARAEAKKSTDSSSAGGSSSAGSEASDSSGSS